MPGTIPGQEVAGGLVPQAVVSPAQHGTPRRQSAHIAVVPAVGEDWGGAAGGGEGGKTENL